MPGRILLPSGIRVLKGVHSGDVLGCLGIELLILRGRAFRDGNRVELHRLSKRPISRRHRRERLLHLHCGSWMGGTKVSTARPCAFCCCIGFFFSAALAR